MIRARKKQTGRGGRERYGRLPAQLLPVSPSFFFLSNPSPLLLPPPPSPPVLLFLSFLFSPCSRSPFLTLSSIFFSALLFSRFLSRFFYIALVYSFPFSSSFFLSLSLPLLLTPRCLLFSSHFLSRFLLLYGRFFVLYQVAAWNAGVLRPLRAASNR